MADPPSELAPGQLEDLIQQLFGERPYALMQLGESPDTSGLADGLKKLRTDDLAPVGLSVAQQIACSRGRFPLLIVTFDRVVSRDIAGIDLVNALAGEALVTYRYDVIFLDAQTASSIYREIYTSQLERSLRGPNPNRAQSPSSTGHTQTYWPLRRGDRIVHAYFAKKPIPGPAADG